MTKKEIGQEIKEARTFKSMTYQELKDKGVRYETISIIEKGDGNYRIDSLIDLLSALNLELTIKSKTNK